MGISDDQGHVRANNKSKKLPQYRIVRLPSCYERLIYSKQRAIRS